MLFLAPNLLSRELKMGYSLTAKLTANPAILSGIQWDQTNASVLIGERARLSEASCREAK